MKAEKTHHIHWFNYYSRWYYTTKLNSFQ